jgi:hypothetical protein
MGRMHNTLMPRRSRDRTHQLCGFALPSLGRTDRTTSGRVSHNEGVGRGGTTLQQPAMDPPSHTGRCPHGDLSLGLACGTDVDH